MLTYFEPKILCTKLALLFIIVISTTAYSQSDAIQTSGDVLLFAMPASALTVVLLRAIIKAPYNLQKVLPLTKRSLLDLNMQRTKADPIIMGKGPSLLGIPQPLSKVLPLFKKDMGGAMEYRPIF